MSKKKRGFEIVEEAHRTAYEVFTDEKKRQHRFPLDITLPTRSDKGSAGYDFYLPKDVTLLPGHHEVVFTNVKAYMPDDEVLLVLVRSSLAIKQGLQLQNQVGVIDASYYGNEGNDGNIGIALSNPTGKTVQLAQGERIAQGIFTKYYLAEDDAPTTEERKGGIGSSGK